MQFHIQNMTCGGCVKSITRAIHSVDPEATVTLTPGGLYRRAGEAQPSP